MSRISKVTKSRNNWKHKAVDYCTDNRRLRTENARLKKDRDKYKAEAKEAKKEIERLKAAAGAPALKSKLDVVHVCLLLFCVAGLGFRAISRVLGALGCYLGLNKIPCPQT